ncbi:MAG TPA: gephyrin-like molybdotransferase Glp [Pyrinomonadaceae bacterium]|nr:gephyrin-like molybdotransferase Glp [Pyrinomonadaceae bacterium]
MITISEALNIINRETRPLPAEAVDIGKSVGRVLAEDIVADMDMPPFDRAQMDGYAVRASDIENAPVSLKIVGESAAGRGWHNEMKTGEAVRIMTGAPVPAGADAVQKVELTSEDNGTVKIEKSVSVGQSIVARGDEIGKGETIFSAGTIITENMIASLAAFGYAKVSASKRPRVTILPTGTEIVEVDEKPGSDQIRNSNAVMLKAFADRYGVASTLPIARDDIEDLKAKISTAVSESDILVITGGVSVGKYDLTKAALRDLGAEIFFERLQLKPGKPAVFARLDDTLVFGLPGNPVSTAVTFYLFVQKAMLLMQGAAQSDLTPGYAVLTRSGKGAKDRDSYLPATLKTGNGGRVFAEPLKWGGSSDFVGFARAEALIIVPSGKIFDEGDVVEIVFL